ncbi:MAG: tRNA 2-selenouridine synthase [Alphaproteobacteria bacterium MarineAlpha11_Bin1]|nr:MAG: tRNA 2-selenouridine synthase [Alphaproteobacteria bacterium MarineAlpha11_Bin1]
MSPKIERLSSFEFDHGEVIVDVRSPSEFKEDHIPGSINLPVLSDNEFKKVGTIYKEVSPFDASKIGAALVSKNISTHLGEYFYDKPQTTKFVFYCARGGKRSSSFAQVCSMVGWPTCVIDGGYKAYRKHVTGSIEKLCNGYKFLLIGGKTGTGKTEILNHLEVKGYDVLNLERLAVHRGSLLGAHKDQDQPAQKLFETRIFEKIKTFNDQKTIFAEAESNKIGRVFIPAALWKKMKAAPIFIIENQNEHRVSFILKEYDPDFLQRKAIPNLLSFIDKKSNAIDTEKLRKLVSEGKWSEFVQEILTSHYDPLYQHAISKRIAPIVKRLQINQPVEQSIPYLCQELIEACGS